MYDLTETESNRTVQSVEIHPSHCDCRGDRFGQEHRGCRVGPGIRDERGRIDRGKLAEEAFSSPVNVQKINGILHPRVMEQCLRRIEQCRQDPACRGVVLDAPLLLEAGGEGRYDCLIFVDCPPQVRAVRAARKGLGPEDIKKREFFQISLDKKRAMSHYIVQNNSDVFAVAEQVRRIFTTMNDKR